MALIVEKNLDFDLMGLTESDKGNLRAMSSWMNEVAALIFPVPGNEAANAAMRDFLSRMAVAIDAVA